MSITRTGTSPIVSDMMRNAARTTARFASSTAADSIDHVNAAPGSLTFCTCAMHARSARAGSTAWFDAHARSNVSNVLGMPSNRKDNGSFGTSLACNKCTRPATSAPITADMSMTAAPDLAPSAPDSRPIAAADWMHRTRSGTNLAANCGNRHASWTAGRDTVASSVHEPVSRRTASCSSRFCTMRRVRLIHRSTMVVGGAWSIGSKWPCVSRTDNSARAES